MKNPGNVTFSLLHHRCTPRKIELRAMSYHSARHLYAVQAARWMKARINAWQQLGMEVTTT